MKKYLKSLLVLVLVVPCLVMLNACGGSGDVYKFSKIKVTEGETVTNYIISDLQKKLKDDYIKGMTGEQDPTPAQVAVATLEYEKIVLGALISDFADIADDLLDASFNYNFGFDSIIENALSSWNAAGVGTQPSGEATINDYINAVKGTDMTALAAVLYAEDSASFTTETLDTPEKSKAAIKAVLDKLYVAKTAELLSNRISKYYHIESAAMLEMIGGMTIKISGKNLTFKVSADVYLDEYEELYTGQSKNKITGEMENSVGFTKAADGTIIFDDPLFEMEPMKIVGDTIEMSFMYGVVMIFQK